MNDAAFGKSERLLQGWHVYWGHDADYEDCDMCSEGRAELANARKLLEVMELDVERHVCVCKFNPLVDRPVPCETCQMRSLIGACRASAGKNQNA